MMKRTMKKKVRLIGQSVISKMTKEKFMTVMKTVMTVMTEISLLMINRAKVKQRITFMTSTLE